jgi:hypothetical protein
MKIIEPLAFEQIRIAFEDDSRSSDSDPGHIVREIIRFSPFRLRLRHSQFRLLGRTVDHFVCLIDRKISRKMSHNFS